MEKKSGHVPGLGWGRLLLRFLWLAEGTAEQDCHRGWWVRAYWPLSASPASHWAVVSEASALVASSGFCAAVAALRQQRAMPGSSLGAGKSLPQQWEQMQRLELGSSFLSRQEQFKKNL